MANTLTIPDEDKNNVEEIIDLVEAKLGIRLQQKKLVRFLVMDPKAASEIVLQNIKDSA